jgi:hypothetical protein
MSGVVLGSIKTATIPSGGSSARWTQSLGMTPTTRRAFESSDELRAMVEVYDNDVKTPHTVDITSTVVAEDGKTVFTAHEERQSSELQGKPGGYGHTARFSTTEFAPGTYVLTVEARSRAGKTPATTSRSVQFRIRG